LIVVDSLFGGIFVVRLLYWYAAFEIGPLICNKVKHQILLHVEHDLYAVLHRTQSSQSCVVWPLKNVVLHSSDTYNIYKMIVQTVMVIQLVCTILQMASNALHVYIPLF